MLDLSEIVLPGEWSLLSKKGLMLIFTLGVLNYWEVMNPEMFLLSGVWFKDFCLLLL